MLCNFFFETKMADSRYKRVSRKHPCVICGKPDWCSRTWDESVSFCARITDGADRLSRKEHWGVFYHDREFLRQSVWKSSDEPRNFYKQPSEEIRPAPLEIRDFIYNSMLRLSPAGDYQCLKAGTDGLIARGLENFEDYGALPCTTSDRKDLAARLRLLLNRNFPAFVRENSGGIVHIPGFWINESNEACLWLEKDYKKPMLIVPFRNPWGKIQACQIRCLGSLNSGKKRYFWLSLPAMKSAGSGTPLHYANWKNFGADCLNRPVLLTEGALKGDVTAKYRPQFLTVANSGVGCAHDIIAKITRDKKVYLAFDSDYHDNPAVLCQLAKLISLRIYSNDLQSAFENTKILFWEKRFKGIDDALLNETEIIEFSLPEWFGILSVNNRTIIEQILCTSLKF